MFRFAIMGAGNIARTFSNAIRLIQDVEITAIASTSLQRAASFAKQHLIPSYYDDYGAMLELEKPDAVYIATLPSNHAELIKKCLLHRTPVLCEKAMFTNSAEAKELIDLSSKTSTMLMEGMWSRFLPTQRKALEWLSAGRIGDTRTLQISIGCCYDPITQNRYLLPEYGGGAANHLSVYAFELATYYLGTQYKNIEVITTSNMFGTDGINQITLLYENKHASLFTSCVSAVEERMVIAGDKGRIVMEHPHYANAVELYQKDVLAERYQDKLTINGFTYEIEQFISCVMNGQIQSSIIPHRDTLLFSYIQDIVKQNGNSIVFADLKSRQ